MSFYFLRGVYGAFHSPLAVLLLACISLPARAENIHPLLDDRHTFDTSGTRSASREFEYDVPVFVGNFFSRKVLKLNPAEALGYTGAYAFANVILTLAGTLIMLL